MDEINLDATLKNFVLSHVKNEYYRENICSGLNLTNQNTSNISYKNTENKKYIINLEILPFIINSHDKYYKFDKVNLGIEFVIESKNDSLVIIINDPPKILAKNYQHPFVYPDDAVWGNGILAYQNEDWEEKSMLKFGKKLDIFSQTKNSAEKVASVLRVGQELIEMETKIDSVYSIRYLKSLDCLIANNKTDAINYAVTHEIKLKRIFNSGIF
ncbi:MAG: hypothetical protein AABW92_03960 [Nanoarchaeota archaeon]